MSGIKRSNITINADGESAVTVVGITIKDGLVESVRVKLADDSVVEYSGYDSTADPVEIVAAPG